MVDETVIQVNDEHRWLYAAVDPETNEFLHVRLFHENNAAYGVVLTGTSTDCAGRPRGDFGR